MSESDEDLAAAWGAETEGGEGAAPARVLNQAEIDSLLGFDDGPSGSALLHDGLCRLARHFGSSPPLNMWVRTAPRGADHFCWRIDVLPRLTHLAGLELSTDVNLNIVAPEHAAAVLREA